MAARDLRGLSQVELQTIRAYYAYVGAGKKGMFELIRDHIPDPGVIDFRECLELGKEAAIHNAKAALLTSVLRNIIDTIAAGMMTLEIYEWLQRDPADSPCFCDEYIEMQAQGLPPFLANQKSGGTPA